jgi:hypothetical protein
MKKHIAEIIPIRKDDALQAVLDEPELPGTMPDEIWNAIRNDRMACADVMRIAVQKTKQGIYKRILAL